MKLNKTTKWVIITILIILAIGFILIIIFNNVNQEAHFKITKDNLSIKWLEDNCELKQTEKDSSFKYQCGEFIVDVWNQIK